MSLFEQLVPMQDIKNFIDKYYTSVITGGIVVIGLLAGWYYFAVYKVQEDARAHATLTEVLQEVTRAAQAPDVWQDVEVAARTGYRQHKGSSLAPYFLALEADALLQQGNNEDGIQNLTEAVNTMPQDVPLYTLYRLKLARVQLAQEALREQGLATVQQLADDPKSIVHDEALYYLGMYYSQQGDRAQAREILQKLVTEFKDAQGLGQSPWVPLAQDELERLG